MHSQSVERDSRTVSLQSSQLLLHDKLNVFGALLLAARLQYVKSQQTSVLRVCPTQLRLRRVFRRLRDESTVRNVPAGQRDFRRRRTSAVFDVERTPVQHLRLRSVKLSRQRRQTVRSHEPAS